MTDYIKRDDAVSKLRMEQSSHQTLRERMSVNEAVAVIEEIPAADVAPVVFCKDCQNWKRNVGLTNSPNGHCFEHDIDTNGRDFCSYGKRKDNDEH